MFENDKPTWLGLFYYLCKSAGIPDWTNFIRFLFIVMASGNMIWVAIYIIWAWINEKEIAKYKTDNNIK